MERNLLAKASVTVNAPATKVWRALVDPDAIRQYMFGTTVVTDWRKGSNIAWKGEWQGQSYEDKGVILQFKPERLLQYSHFSPLSGLPDTPESYHTVTVELSSENNHTRVSLTQDNNPTEPARDHSQENWEKMLAALKRFLEQ
jgi:uncharacterized protein YndB with AHSA1/START domain